MALVVVLAACAGQPEPTADSSRRIEAVSSCAPISTVAPPAGPSPSAFRDLVRAENSHPYTVTFTLDGCPAPYHPFGSETWFVSGSRTRMDISRETPMESFYVLPEGTFECPHLSDGLQCFNSSLTLDVTSPAAKVDREIRRDPDRFRAAFAGTRRIANADAQCFDLSPTASDTSFSVMGDPISHATICYAANGTPLFVRFETQGDAFIAGFFIAEATSYGIPREDDFALPATPGKRP